MISLLLAAFLSWSAPSWGGPIVVGSGAGEAEFALVFTRTYLPILLSECQVGNCRLSDQESAALDLLQDLASHPPQAVFKDSKVLGNQVFQVDRLKGEVDFNADLLWQDAQRTVPIGEADALSIWVDVLSRMSSENMPDLSHLKSQLASVMNRQFVTSGLSVPGVGGFQSLIWTEPSANDRLYLRDPSLSHYDFTRLVTTQLECPGDATAREVRFYSMRWGSRGWQPDRSLGLQVDLTAVWKCPNGAASRSRVTLIFETAPSDQGIYVMDPKSARAFLQGQ